MFVNKNREKINLEHILRDIVNYDTDYVSGAYGNNVSPQSDSKKHDGLEIFQLVRSVRDRIHVVASLPTQSLYPLPYRFPNIYNTRGK
jgi:hypothetical protein